MTWQGLVFVAVHVLAFAISLGLAGVAWRNRKKREALIFGATVAAAAAWAASDALGLLVAGVGAKLFFRTVGYLWHNVVVVSVLAFALSYTGAWRRVGTRRFALLALPPMAVGLVVTPTNALGLHQLVWTDVSVVSVGRFSALSPSFGPWYWVNTGYNYLLVLAAMGLFVRLAVRSTGAHRKQAIALVVGAIPPFLANVLWVSGTTAVDLTSVALAATGIVYGVALFRFRLLDLLPVVRDAVLESIHEGYVVLDDRDRVVDLNPAARELLPGCRGPGDRAPDGRESGDRGPIGIPAVDLLPDLGDLIDRHDHGETIEAHVAVGEEPRYLAVEVRSLARKRREGRLVVVRDVTEHKHREEALRRQNERLDEFASVVSHDLRNPLSVIHGRLELARETGEREQFDAMASAVERMEALIEDLLTLARAGEALGETTSVSLADLAREAFRTADTENASLEIEDDVVLEADETRLRQLLANLLGNAVEHAGTEVTVRVGALGIPGSPSDGFYVEDDGPGIPTIERDVVFTRGVSGSPSGTGYGLAIVEEIAEAHGWSVGVTESGDGGARFEFTGIGSGVEVDVDVDATGEGSSS